MDGLVDVHFWLQVIASSNRPAIGDAGVVIICSAWMEAQIRELVATYGLSRVVTVEGNCYIPRDRLYIQDREAQLAASWEALGSAARRGELSE